MPANVCSVYGPSEVVCFYEPICHKRGCASCGVGGTPSLAISAVPHLAVFLGGMN